MALSNGGGVLAASGYPQYAGVFTSPVFSAKLQERFWHSTVFTEITETGYLGELSRCGDQLTFFTTPRVRVQNYVKDGQLKHDTFETKPITLSIDNAMAYSFKIDAIDERMMCNSAEWVKSVLNEASREMANTIDRNILCQLYLEASPANRGAQAGACSGCYNLGEVGAPLAITPLNVLDFMSNLAAVFDEAAVPMENRWIVVPPKFLDIVRRSELRSACVSGLGQSTMLNGRVGERICGFQMYTSSHLPMVIDPVTNAPTWNLVAGWKGAVVFASSIEQARRIDSDKDNFDIFYQGLSVWGAGVVRKDALAHIYCTLA